MSAHDEISLDNKPSHLEWLNPNSTDVMFGKPFQLSPGLFFIFVKMNDSENINFALKSSATMFLKNKFIVGPISDDKLIINFQWSEKHRLIADLVNFLLSRLHDFVMSQAEDCTARQLLIDSSQDDIKTVATWPSNNRLNAKLKVDADKSALTQFIEMRSGATFVPSSLSAFKEFIVGDMKERRDSELDAVVHITGFVISEKGIYPCFKLWSIEFPLVKPMPKTPLKRSLSSVDDSKKRRK